MTDGRNFFNQLVKKNGRTYDNIREIKNVHRDDYTTVGCLLSYPYFKKCWFKIVEEVKETILEFS